VKEIKSGDRCEGLSVYADGTLCGGPVVAIIQKAREPKPVKLCMQCADHQLRSMGGKLLSSPHQALVREWGITTPVPKEGG